MYLIFGAILVIIVGLFGNSVFSMIKQYTTNANPNFKVGNIWFIGLLLVNVMLISFVFGFYYYKSNSIGEIGLTGDKGFTGYDGEPCVITQC